MDALAKPDALLEIIAYRRDRFGIIADIFTRESSQEALRLVLSRAQDFRQEEEGTAEYVLGSSLAGLPCSDFESFATLTRTEYARLFLGPREVVAPLHESAYLSGTSRMFTAETLAVRSFYEYLGYKMKAKNREPEDAVGVEFEFLRNLCTRCIHLLENHLDSSIDEVRQLLGYQRDFKAQHLDRWAREFSRRVVENDKSGFYAAWARYLVDVLDEDGELLGECERLLLDFGGR